MRKTIKKILMEDEFGLYSATAADFLLYETDLEDFDDRFEFLYEVFPILRVKFL